MAQLDSELQQESHAIDVKHLQLENNDSAIYEFKSNPLSNVSKSSEFMTDILKQWTRINGNSTELSQMKIESELNNDCLVFRTCNCIKRIIFIMTFYDEWCRKNGKKKKCKGLSINDIIEGLPNYNVIQLWNDFLHCKMCHFVDSLNNQSTIIECIHVWEYIESKLGQSDLTKCNKFARNNRSKNSIQTSEQRMDLYFGFVESEEIVTIQFCDIIWDFLFHSKVLFKNEFANNILYNPQKIEEKITENSTDNTEMEVSMARERRVSHKQRQSINGTIGKRIQQRLQMQKEKEFQKRDSITKTEQKSDEFIYSENDKKEFETFIQTKNDTLNDSNVQSKFVTNSETITVEKNNNISFGVSFVYWKGYKTWNNYIKSAKFDSLKSEILSNPFYKLTLFQWTDTCVKALKLSECNIGQQWRSKNAGILNVRYGIAGQLPISKAHIVSVLLYINFKHLQYLFKTNGCNKLQSKESLSSVKERNRSIGNWYKLFTESITLFGDITNKTQIFYHGLSKQILFNSFKPNFNCMISCTSLLSIAQSIISNNPKGIIIKLQQKRSLPYGFLDVHWLSDFQNEFEKIFSFSKLDIIDIYKNEPTFQSNVIFVKSLILFQSILKGQYFEHTLHIDLRYQKVIIQFVQNWLVKNSEIDMFASQNNSEQSIDIPMYMQLLFNSFINNTNVFYLIRSQYQYLCEDLQKYLIDFASDNSYEFGVFLETIKGNKNGRLKLGLMKEFRWEISGDKMKTFKGLKVNETMKGKFFHAGNNVVLYPRLRRSDKDFSEKAMIFCYIEDMPKDYKRVSLQWEIFCKETMYHSSIQTRFLNTKEFAGYTVSDTKELCALDSFTFQIAVQIIDIDKE